MSDKALRYDQGKPELVYLLDFNRALDAVAKVCEQGAIKYAPLNWKKGGKPDEEYINSCLRHLKEWRNDGQYDRDLGTLHVANAAWNLLALLELNICSEQVCSETGIGRSGYPTLDPTFDQEAFILKYKEHMFTGDNRTVA